MKSPALILLVALLGACSQQTPGSAPPAPTAIVLPAGMTRVGDSSQVCMVNDQYMGRPQIPVEVEGRTYFGCCEMCKAKLNERVEARTARDPVTGEAVDKSKAIIVQDAQGKVLYFASEATLQRFGTGG